MNLPARKGETVLKATTRPITISMGEIGL